jgi:Protein of unknown function (DUF3017)
VSWLKTPSTIGGAIYLSVLAGALLGVATAASGAWRLGVTVIGVCVGVAFLARMLLPADRTGMLRIRRRFVDLTTMALCGLGLVVLAIVIPNRK